MLSGSTIMFLAGDQYNVAVDDIVEKSSATSGTWYETARALRKYPTIAMGRAILAAPIINRNILISGSSARARTVLEKVLLPIYKAYNRSAVYSCIDYGWLAHEVQPYKQRINGVYPVVLKPLKHEYTDLTANKQGFVNGAINWLPTQRNPTKDHTVIKKKNFAHVAVGDEYANPYGNAVLKNVEDVHEAYQEVEDSAKRYNKRIAGSHWKLTFPVGFTPIAQSDGTSLLKDNSTIAAELLASLQSSGAIAIPVSPDSIKGMLEGQVGASTSPAWSLELISEVGAQDIFLDRQRFLDALMMRGLILPERVALEGQFGTKAEASEHADIAVSAIEQFGDNMLEWVNGPTGLCACILGLHKIDWYPGIAYVDPMPLADDAKQFMREILRTMLNGESTLYRTIDLPELGRKTNIPIIQKQFNTMVDAAVEMEAAGVKLASNPPAPAPTSTNTETGDATGN